MPDSLEEALGSSAESAELSPLQLAEAQELGCAQRIPGGRATRPVARAVAAATAGALLLAGALAAAASWRQGRFAVAAARGRHGVETLQLQEGIEAFRPGGAGATLPPSPTVPQYAPAPAQQPFDQAGGGGALQSPQPGGGAPAQEAAGAMAAQEGTGTDLASPQQTSGFSQPGAAGGEAVGQASAAGAEAEASQGSGADLASPEQSSGFSPPGAAGAEAVASQSSGADVASPQQPGGVSPPGTAGAEAAGQASAAGAVAVASQVAAASAEAAASQHEGCTDRSALSHFSSREIMEQAGWYFSWDDNSFKPEVSLQGSLMIDQYVASTSYWGYSMTGSGQVTTVLRGSGVVSVDFGNPGSTPNSLVQVLINEREVASAPPFTLSQRVEVPFKSGDWLTVNQNGGIILINSISVACSEDATTTQEEIKADPCQCKAIWTYAGDSYGGCTQTRDSGFTSWCYVEGDAQLGGAACKDAFQSNVEDGRYWRSCLDPCECLERWSYITPGSSVEVSYRRCAKTPDAEKPWCYVLGSEECSEAKRSDVATTTGIYYFRECNMSHTSAPSEQEVEDATQKWKDAHVEIQKGDMEVRKKQEEYDRVSNLSNAVTNLTKGPSAENTPNVTEQEEKERLQKAAELQKQRSKEELEKAKQELEESQEKEAKAAEHVEDLLTNRSKSQSVKVTTTPKTSEQNQEDDDKEEEDQKDKDEKEEKDKDEEENKDKNNTKDDEEEKKDNDAEDNIDKEESHKNDHDGEGKKDKDEEDKKDEDEDEKDVDEKDNNDKDGEDKKDKDEADTKEEDEDEEEKDESPKEVDKGPSLYCFSLTMPFGYEPNLLLAQKKSKVGIFACEEWVVFTNESKLMDTGKGMPFDVEMLYFSLQVPFGGKWYTALNTPIFNKIWSLVVKLENFRKHDWVVKVDPDCVFFPDRLRYMLLKHVHLPDADTDADEPVAGRRLGVSSEDDELEQIDGEMDGFEANCGMCQMPGFEDTTCGSHISWLQTQGTPCPEAVRLTARDAPEDCGCTQCTEIEACDLSVNPDFTEDGKVYVGSNPRKEAMYINNCKFGLHGPIEVLSSAAVDEYITGLDRCNALTVHAWGEDKFLDKCLLELGVTRVNRFELLSEEACAENPVPCGGSDIAFHPFKTSHSYFACWKSANQSSSHKH